MNLRTKNDSHSLQKLCGEVIEALLERNQERKQPQGSGERRGLTNADCLADGARIGMIIILTLMRQGPRAWRVTSAHTSARAALQEGGAAVSGDNHPTPDTERGSRTRSADKWSSSVVHGSSQAPAHQQKATLPSRNTPSELVHKY